MVEFLQVRRWKKKKSCNWRVVKECIVSIQYGGVGVLEFKVYKDL